MASDAAALIVRSIDLLARGGATGTLRVSNASRSGSVSLVGGRIAHVEAPGAAPLLGELLGIEREPEASGGWIGERIRREGLASSGAVIGAHREQMRARLMSMMSWRNVSITLEQGSPRTAPGVDPAHAADVVLEALRRTVSDVPMERVRDRLKSHEWMMTALGRSFALRAALHPDEAAVMNALHSPLDFEAIERVCGGSARALRFTYALAFVEAAAMPVGAGSMSLLARKTNEVRQFASARRLLDLPVHAHAADARGALRRWARDLHPDRFEAHAPAAIREASNEVVSAMTRAAASVR